MLNFIKYKMKKGYSNDNNIVSSEPVFNTTPKTKGALNKVLSWSHSNGLLGGCRASFEASGILFMFYQSRLFSKSFQGSYFIPYNKIIAYNEGQDQVLRILFDKGIVFFPIFNIYNKKSPSYKIDVKCLHILIKNAGINHISNGTYKDFKNHLNNLTHQVTVHNLKGTDKGRKMLAKKKRKKEKETDKSNKKSKK